MRDTTSHWLLSIKDLVQTPSLLQVVVGRRLELRLPLYSFPRYTLSASLPCDIKVQFRLKRLLPSQEVGIGSRILHMSGFAAITISEVSFVEESREEYDALKKLMGPLVVPDQDWDIFVKGTMVRRLKRDYFAVRAGETVHCAYFCIKGLFRFFYTLDDGKEFTKSFAIEGDFVTSYGAMISGEPSYFSIQALEEALVIEIPYGLLLELADRSRYWERFLRHSVEQLYRKKEERERELLYLSAAERLEAFKMKYPGLEARIPQYFIASYLGISPVSLSRIVHQSKT